MYTRSQTHAVFHVELCGIKLNQFQTPFVLTFIVLFSYYRNSSAGRRSFPMADSDTPEESVKALLRPKSREGKAEKYKVRIDVTQAKYFKHDFKSETEVGIKMKSYGVFKNGKD